MKTWKDVEKYLLDNMDKANDDKSKSNPSFTKAQMWDMYMGQCIEGVGQLPVRTSHILVANIKKDF